MRAGQSKGTLYAFHMYQHCMQRSTRYHLCMLLLLASATAVAVRLWHGECYVGIRGSERASERETGLVSGAWFWSEVPYSSAPPGYFRIPGDSSRRRKRISGGLKVPFSLINWRKNVGWDGGNSQLIMRRNAPRGTTPSTCLTNHPIIRPVATPSA